MVKSEKKRIRRARAQSKGIKGKHIEARPPFLSSPIRWEDRFCRFLLG